MSGGQLDRKDVRRLKQVAKVTENPLRGNGGTQYVAVYPDGFMARYTLRPKLLGAETTRLKRDMERHAAKESA